MTNPFGEEQNMNDLTRALGIIALLEMIDHVNQVATAFEIAGVFTPEGTNVFTEKTTDYFNALNDLIKAEREIYEAQKVQSDI